jgi:hypothetical protein
MTSYIPLVILFPVRMIVQKIKFSWRYVQVLPKLLVLTALKSAIAMSGSTGVECRYTVYY